MERVEAWGYQALYWAKNFVGNKVWKIKFPNGYTASVVSGPTAYGNASRPYEVGVIHDGQLVYDTPVTDDVMTFLDDTGVKKVLKKIKNLPPRKAVVPCGKK